MCLCGIALWEPAISGATTASNCSAGRSLLQCGEKQGIYNDAFNWAAGGVLDLVLFETRLPVPLKNPALARFWRFETATALARYGLEFASVQQLTDPDFEHLAPAATLPAPAVRAGGVVTRQMAAAMSRLMLAEQQEVVNLGAFNTALNRATAALIERSRADWVAWQASAAAGFALHAAAAIGRVRVAERALTRSLVHARLLFGVGPVDLRRAQRYVRAHGLARSVTDVMTTLGVPPILLALIKDGFVNAGLGPTSFSLSQYFSSPTVTAGEKRCADALRHFAARIPRAGRPPS